MYSYPYPRPAVTVDALVFNLSGQALKILLINRARPPFEGFWALPGGFIEMDEDLEAACLRELSEETGLGLFQMKQFRTYGRPGRDPRGRTISVVFYHLIPGDPPQPKAGDDAGEAQWFPAEAPPPLAFDHAEILRDALLNIHFSNHYNFTPEKLL